MKSSLILLFLFVAASGCEKDDPKEFTKTDHISSAKWKYETGGIDGNNDGTIDINFTSAMLADCVLDNEATFNANGTGVADEGTTKCNMASPQTSPFTWNFSSNETSVGIMGSGVFGLGGQFKVRELTSTKFALAKDTTVPGFPQSVQLIVNLKH